MSIECVSGVAHSRESVVLTRKHCHTFTDSYDLHGQYQVIADRSNSDQAPSGMLLFIKSTLRNKLGGLAVPIRTEATIGFRSGNCNAAAASDIPESMGKRPVSPALFGVGR